MALSVLQLPSRDLRVFSCGVRRVQVPVTGGRVSNVSLSLSGTKGNNTLYQELPAYRYFRLRNVVMSHDHHVKDSGHCIVQCSL